MAEVSPRHSKSVHSPRIHSSRPKGSGAEANAKCHTGTGLVERNNSEIIASPRLFAIYWDAYFEAHPGAVRLMNRFFSEILTGPYMDGLGQYGVGPGSLAGYLVTTDDAPASLSAGELEQRLTNWLDDGAVPLKPASDESQLCYVIFTPVGTELTLNGLSSKLVFSGYHEWDTYGKFLHIGENNLFWAAIAWEGLNDIAPQTLVAGLTSSAGHEMVEAFTDPGDDGYKRRDDCEIGDICELLDGVMVDGWSVPRYWSNSDRACVPDGPLFKWLPAQQNDAAAGGIARGIAAVSGPDGESMQVFGTNAIENLIIYYWSPAPDWQVGDIGAGQQIGRQLAALNGPDAESLHAFGINRAGDLIHFYMGPQPNWLSENLTRLTPIGVSAEIPTPAVTAVYSITDNLIALNSLDRTAQYAFGRNVAGEVIRYFWHLQDGWRVENLTNNLNTGATYVVAGNLAVLNGLDGESQFVFGRNNNGDLIVYLWHPDVWHAANVTQDSANIGSDYRIADNLSALHGPKGHSMQVLGKNIDGELIIYFWNPANWKNPMPNWQADNVTRRPNIGALYQIASDLFALNGPDGESQHVFGRNHDGDLIHYYYYPAPDWAAENLTKRQNIGASYRITGKFIVLNGPDGNSMQVFGTNTDGELIIYYWSPQPSWQANNVTERPNFGAAYRIASDLVAFNGPDGKSQYAFGRNRAGDLIIYYWSPAPDWRAENLTKRPTIGSNFTL